MSNPKWTPGPWHHDSQNVYADNGMLLVAQVHAGLQPQRQANSALMAAAPEMAEALEAVNKLLEAILNKAGDYRLPETECPLVHYVAYHHDSIRAALRKARGES